MIDYKTSTAKSKYGRRNVDVFLTLDTLKEIGLIA